VEDQVMSPMPMVLLPMAASPPSSLVLLVRTTDAAASLPIVRAAVRATEPLAPLDTISTLAAKVNDVFSGLRGIVIAGTTMGALAVLLAAVGQYAVLAFSVRRRTREIGIRMAVGATRSSVLASVLTQGLTVTAVGLGLGFALAVPMAVVMRAVFLGVSPFDPWTMAPVAAAMLLVGGAASLLPAFKAVRVEPVVALRED
jgi:putative ABC transport system permease protein